MPLLDLKGDPAVNGWVRVADDEAVSGHSAVVVSFDRLLTEGDALFSAAPAVGVELTGTSEVEKLAPFVERLGLAVFRFPAFKDGRPFTLARILKERLGYKGELRAAGDFLPDQALFLLRCGFTSFDVADTFPADALKKSLDAFSAWYQPTGDGRAVVFRQRHEGAAP